jgi:glycosyltransferase involved in cell wall biosynthesis
MKPKMIPLFSIVIPTFNRKNILRGALESIWSQTLDDYEVIVVDDGSTDGTWEYLQSLGERVTALRQNNSGPGAARNLAARSARSEYLAFLDSDDTWFPWTLEQYAEAIERYERPALISGSGAIEGMAIDDDPQGVFTQYQSLLDACVGFLPPVGGTPSIAIRRDVFEKLGGFEARNINAEDVDLWLRCGEEVGFVRVNSPPVFLQSYLEVSASRNLDAQFRGVEFVIEQEKSDSYPGGGKYRRSRERIIAAMARSISFECLAASDYRRSWNLYAESMMFQVRQCRVRYLVGFPAKWAWQRLKESF